uniref:Uncharacterized protein n=1 Tax=Arundo donax TaxID=35708 RepID=A0A0A9B1N5_ARUDO
MGRGGPQPPGVLLLRCNPGGGLVPRRCDAAVGGRAAAVGACELAEVWGCDRRGAAGPRLGAGASLPEGRGSGSRVLAGEGAQRGGP